MKRGNFYIFENKTFSNIESADCNDSVSGECKDFSTFEECLNFCKENNDCKSGYFIETADKNICVPLYKHTAHQSPYYRLRNKDIYPELKALKSTAFVKDEYKFPPDMPNIVFYGDSFALQNVDTKLFISLNNDGEMTEQVSLGEEGISMQFLPTQITGGNIENYTPVSNGDNVVINIPSSSFILRKKEIENEMYWIMRATDASVTANIIEIHSSVPGNDILNFSTPVYFTYQGMLVLYDEELRTLVTKNISLDKAKNYLFKLIPKVQVYYCDKSSNGRSSSCQKVLLESTERDGAHAKYKGVEVSRSPDCWGVCDKKSKRGYLWIVCIGVIGIFLFIFYMYYPRSKKRRSR